MTDVESFETTIQKTNAWLKDLMESEGWEDRHRAYLALRAALHALRDRLTVEDAAHLAAQLPMLVRGFYYEGWEPSQAPDKTRLKSKEAFLSHVADLMPADPELDSERVVRAVFELLLRKISRGEVQHIKSALPKDIRDMWPKMESEL